MPLAQALDTALARADEGSRSRFANSQPKCDATTPTGQPDDGDSLTPGADLTSGSTPAIIDAESENAGGGAMGWLQVAPNATAPPDGSDVGEIIRWYRMREGLSQQAVADRLHTTQSKLSKLEKGTQILRDVNELRHVARQLGIPPERLGVLRDHS